MKIKYKKWKKTEIVWMGDESACMGDLCIYDGELYRVTYVSHGGLPSMSRILPPYRNMKAVREEGEIYWIGYD